MSLSKALSFISLQNGTMEIIYILFWCNMCNMRLWSLSKPTDPEALGRVQVQFLLYVLGRPSTQPIEDVVVPLVVTLHTNPRLL